MILCYLFLLHFIADFIFQSREMGKKKSIEFKWLLKHLLIQLVIFYIGLFSLNYYLTTVKMLFFFPLYNIIIHCIIDWNIWKLYKVSVYMRMINNFSPEVLKSTTKKERIKL